MRPMRRFRQELTAEECVQVLERGTHGVLAVLGDEGYPYAVPLSYVHGDGKLWFHCAQAGHKLDAIRNYNKVSFCVVDQDQIVPEEYTSYFRSVIAFGTIRELENDGEKRAAIEKLARKYAPDDTAEGLDAAIRRDWAPLCMLEMTIDHMTGKEAIELVKAKEAKN